MNLKITFTIIAFSFSTVASAAHFALGGGESAIIQPNVSTRVSCSGSGGSEPDGNHQCMQENANLRVHVNQLQNDLHQCRLFSERPKVWNCVYNCGGNNGMGTDADKSVACRAAKRDSGVQCSAQCECTQE